MAWRDRCDTIFTSGFRAIDFHPRPSIFRKVSPFSCIPTRKKSNEIGKPSREIIRSMYKSFDRDRSSSVDLDLPSFSYTLCFIITFRRIIIEEIVSQIFIGIVQYWKALFSCNFIRNHGIIQRGILLST